MKRTVACRKKTALMLCMMLLALTPYVPDVSAQQSKYPEKPIELIVPFGIGGGTDIAMRFLSSTINEYLGQPVVVINKPGASGSLCMEYVVKQAKRDGYAMMGATAGPNAVFPARFLQLPFKWDDVTFIARLQLTPMILAVKADSPFKTLKDMLDAIKTNPGKLTFSTAGIQTTQGIGPYVLMKAANIPYNAIRPIHYEGGGAANLALMRGDVDFLYNLAPATIMQVRAGSLRALAVPVKMKDLPDVPTFGDLRLGEMNITGWQGICGPPNLPDYVVKKWSEAAKKLMSNEAWLKMVDGVGDIPAFLEGAEFKAFAGDEFKRYRGIFEALGLTKDRP